MLKFYAFLSESKIDATYQSALDVLPVFWHAILLFLYSLSHTQAEVA
jgi:fucose 4-O-acetylase-like acetyltransferase